MPMKAAVREILPRTHDLGVQIFTLEHFTRIAQRQGDNPLRPTAPAEPEEVTSPGNISALIGSEGSPAARIRMRSMMLISWRTLPGQDGPAAWQWRHRPVCVWAGRWRLNPVDEVIRQFGDVLAPLRQPGTRAAPRSSDGTGPHGAPGRDLGAQIARGRGNDSHIDLHIGCPAHAAEALFDQDRRIRPWVSRGMSQTSSR